MRRMNGMSPYGGIREYPIPALHGLILPTITEETHSAQSLRLMTLADAQATKTGEPDAGKLHVRDSG